MVRQVVRNNTDISSSCSFTALGGGKKVRMGRSWKLVDED